jgi:hypothetical protein
MMRMNMNKGGGFFCREETSGNPQGKQCFPKIKIHTGRQKKWSYGNERVINSRLALFTSQQGKSNKKYHLTVLRYAKIGHDNS